jgi:hypothetical protein
MKIQYVMFLFGLTFAQASVAGIVGGGGGPPPAMETIDRDEFTRLSQDILDSSLKGQELPLLLRNRELRAKTVDVFRQRINTQALDNGGLVILVPEEPNALSLTATLAE